MSSEHAVLLAQRAARRAERAREFFGRVVPDEKAAARQQSARLLKEDFAKVGAAVLPGSNTRWG